MLAMTWAKARCVTSSGNRLQSGSIIAAVLCFGQDQPSSSNCSLSPGLERRLQFFALILSDANSIKTWSKQYADDIWPCIPESSFQLLVAYRREYMTCTK
jgi:hypothetical protein